MDIELPNTTGPSPQNDANAKGMDFEGRNPARGLSSDDRGTNVLAAQRMTYQAQVDVIRRQIGGLEEVRGKLGLSARRMCQLLLVDPSAWSRWTRNPSGPPPHVWRALQWYMILNEKIPGLTPEYFVGRSILTEAAVMRRDLETKYAALEKGQIAWSQEQKTALNQLQLNLAEASQKELLLQQKISSLEERMKRIHRLNTLLIVGLAGVGALALILSRSG